MAKRRDMLERLAVIREAGKSEIADGTLAKVRQFTVSLRGSKMIEDAAGQPVAVVQVLELSARTGLLDVLTLSVDIDPAAGLAEPRTLERDVKMLTDAVARGLSQLPVLHRRALEVQGEHMRAPKLRSQALKTGEAERPVPIVDTTVPE